MTDWIEHSGHGEPDLPAATIVEVKLLTGWPGMKDDIGRVDQWDWIHDPKDPGQNIVAYRVVPHE